MNAVCESDARAPADLVFHFFDHVVVSRGRDRLDLVVKFQCVRELFEQIDAEALEVMVAVVDVGQISQVLVVLVDDIRSFLYRTAETQSS